eukprot:4238377-Pyramimonas_sp.AAC.1
MSHACAPALCRIRSIGSRVRFIHLARKQKHVCCHTKLFIDGWGSPYYAGEEFMENLGNAAKALQDKLPKVIDFVGGKTLADL